MCPSVCDGHFWCPVSCPCDSFPHFCYPIDQLRADFFFKMKYILDEEEAQRRGVVGIVYNKGMESDSLMLELLTTKVLYAIPFNVGALHYCMDRPDLFEHSKHSHSLLLDKNHFIRTRYHVGKYANTIEPTFLSFYSYMHAHVSLISFHFTS